MQPNLIATVSADSSASARLTMVDSQIRPNRVTNPALLDAFELTPRDLFAAPSHRAMAYLEGDCPVASGRVMLAPTTLARLIDALQLTSTDTVLDVGGMTGYSAAIMSALTGRVTMQETDTALATAAEKNFQQLQIVNVTVSTAALDRTIGELYSAIFFEGAIAQFPDTLVTQLMEGGRMVAIVGGSATVPGHATLATKLHGSLSQTVLFEAAAAYLPGMAPRKEFTF